MRRTRVQLKTGRPLAAYLVASVGKHALQSLPPDACRRRQKIEVKGFDFIRGGVVQRRHKHGGLRNRNAPCLQALAHRRLVEQLRQAARIDLACLTTARTAVQSGSVGVVGGLAAMPNQQHQRHQVLVQAHRMQHAGRQRDLCVEI